MLNAAALAASLSPTLKTAHLTVGAVDNPALTLFCQNLAVAIATAVVAHIQSSAVVVPTALAAPSGGGPVTGTGTVT